VVWSLVTLDLSPGVAVCCRYTETHDGEG
jgi:hypothetical protein